MFHGFQWFQWKSHTPTYPYVEFPVSISGQFVKLGNRKLVTNLNETMKINELTHSVQYLRCIPTTWKLTSVFPCISNVWLGFCYNIIICIQEFIPHKTEWTL